MSPAFSNHNSSGIQPSTLHSPQPRQIFLQPLRGFHRGLVEGSIILLVPTISIAAFVALRRLFTIIINNALTVWANRPLSNQVVIEAGEMRLEFGCAMQPVPMEFVAEFAASQRDAVERGFAPVFAKEWWWDGGDKERMCYVGLRYVGDGGVVAPPQQ